MSSELSTTAARIVAAARALLEAPEPAGLRMSDIAAAAGVSRQAVYLHFRSRAELLIAVTHAIDRDLGLDARLAESRAATTGEERLSAWVRFWGDYLPDISTASAALLPVSGGKRKEMKFVTLGTTSSPSAEISSLNQARHFSL
mgnify:CR=1 FL=1